MSTDLPKTFDPAEIEARWYAHWEGNGLFRPERPDAQPFTIVNPPPNVTGSLHIGHALDNTLQDIVVRYERLRGKDALWVVGTDHAGIATQMVVERELEKRQDKRTNYSREDFVAKVWEWKEESGGTITRQLRRLGCSMDWSREQFTMSPEFTRAVTKVFVDLYNQRLIYRDKRLVNWDPKLKTAISDLEVETQDIKGHFWHFKYPLADGVTLDSGQDYIEVATTRPETMLADMAVAVHPSDERYASVIGKEIVQPITGRRFKVIADEHADPELGSGAVKITPGHDFNDFEVGKRAGIAPGEMLNMLDAEGNVCQTADGLVPEEFLGLHRFRKDGVDGARELVVARMKELGCLIPHIDKEGEAHDAEPRTIATPFGDRGGVVIEPWLTDQWYVDAEKLAQAPIEAVRSGKIEIVPKSWEKTFFNWMENIQPWCVSRQLWWGHRIPAWYAPDGEVFVAESEAQALELALDHFGAERPEDLPELSRDPDVLDTWFSSALWPFATLGWPDAATEQPESVNDNPGVNLLAKHYPNDLLISGFDILFFWDARMAMQGMHFLGEVPWKRLYLHGLVRAADGQKMSKSKGNVVDPLGLIDTYGADALRFFMAAMESQGRDVKMDESRVEGYRNFATKLWNATRFCQANGIGGSQSIAAPQTTSAVNKWIVGEVVETLATLDKAMADLRFDAAANAIYRFVWDTFCDWYLELIKGQIDDETRAVAGWALDQILVMLHPFMPFITEELWHAQGERPYELILAKWPEPSAKIDTEAKAEIEWLIDLTRNLRAAKNEIGLAPGAKLEAWLADPSPIASKILSTSTAALDRVVRLSAVHAEAAPEGAALQVGVGSDSLVIPLEGLIDVEAEKARLTKALAASEKEAKSLEGRLSNANFIERAKPEAVEKARADHAHHAAEAERLRAALDRLG
ncbi:valine--tRNA ligase [Pelagerythrobacter rhizovicinus]|uniref:Valine--tRNA ligase n=1 Tax=Pelagerythrobacter rhizovicinus TaxID=2268576 RepID=A0A4Q2KGD1_9SPHN|nr:valine--tRNA ligase [Pelagerythrobacter rhizovicinus]RXZ64114.1 valine--tRNA ligase [Pelagerythrobacter rhizovicinus]